MKTRILSLFLVLLLTLVLPLSAWADGSAVSAENSSGVVWALERGVMNGFGDGYLHPGQSATCGEAIEMIRTLQQKL